RANLFGLLFESGLEFLDGGEADGEHSLLHVGEGGVGLSLIVTDEFGEERRVPKNTDTGRGVASDRGRLDIFHPRGEASSESVMGVGQPFDRGGLDAALRCEKRNVRLGEGPEYFREHRRVLAAVQREVQIHAFSPFVWLTIRSYQPL